MSTLKVPPSSNPVMALMDDICAWLKANGIEPRHVPVDAVPKVEAGRIAVRMYKTDANGSLYLDGDAPAEEVRLFPLVEEPPGVLVPWLNGKVRWPHPNG